MARPRQLALLLLTGALQLVAGQPKTLPTTYSACRGQSSKVVGIECIMDRSSQRVVDLRLRYSGDNVVRSLCARGGSVSSSSSDDGSQLSSKQLWLTGGNSIYGLRVCLRPGAGEMGVAGVVISASDQTVVCGSPYDPNLDCGNGLTAEAAPLGDVAARCGAGGITAVTGVCFNEVYAPAAGYLVPENVCPPGQGRQAPNQPCKPCPRGSFSAGGQNGGCTPCPEGLFTPREGATQCGCRPGWGATSDTARPGLVCEPCRPGFFSPGGTQLPCIRCPGNALLTTPEGANSVTQCVCPAGYGSTPDNPRTCSLCPLGSWSDATVTFSAGQLQPQPGGGNDPDAPESYTDCCTAWNHGKGKGQGGCPWCTPSWQFCTPCCKPGDAQCVRTTQRVGSRRASDCVEPSPASYVPLGPQG